MKVHKYQVLAAADSMSWIHGERSPQNRLYIPNKGILCYGYYKKDSINCFLDDAQSIKQEGEKAIAGTLENSEYLGEIEVPDNQIDELIASFKTKTQAENEFKKKALSLVSLLK